MRTLAVIVLAAALLLLLGGPKPAQAKLKLQASISGTTTEFKNAVTDYVVVADRCADVRMQVKARGPVRAQIGRGRVFERRNARSLTLAPGQAIRLRALGSKPRKHDKRAKIRDHFIRCLPVDFPTYEFARYGDGAVEMFAASPFGGSFGPKYAIVFDDRGVPIWWKKSDDTPVLDVKPLPGGAIAWSKWYGGGFGTNPGMTYELHWANGHRFLTLRTVGTVTDHHDLEATRDGNYLLLSYRPRPGVDLSAHNGDADATVLDSVIQKISPEGALLWEWSSADHIDPAETGRFYGIGIGSDPYDLTHINSVEEMASGDYMISLRHTDAVYRIDRHSGEVEWKLGGTPTSESLEIAADPLSGPGAQHDAREEPDGTITLFDNGSGLGRAPRAARYRIESGTAYLVDQQSDSEIPSSGCCGSARLVGDSWLIGWGGNPIISEYGPDGHRLFQLTFDEGQGFSYRANPVEGEISKQSLRRGMNQLVGLKP